MELSTIIKDKICSEGPLSFHDFMDMALYYPELGYYSSEKNKIGAEGDYYTGPVLSSLFGQLICNQIEEMWWLLDKRPFTIVEYGAGTGALCCDILKHLEKNTLLYHDLKYRIIEKSESMKKLQQQLLPSNVSWHDSIEELSPVTGCILSNEVLDNFPVHRVRMKKELMEVFVDYKDGFEELLRPAGKKLTNYLHEQNIELPENYCTEINLDAIDWIRDIASNLATGFVITIDYGFSCNELYNTKRNSGTLICYKDHCVNDSVYSDIGEQDITAHVNFSALHRWGQKYNLECTGFTTQANFLRSLGLMNCLRKIELEKGNIDFIIQIQKLLMDMGDKFKVLIQQKGVKSRTLTGVQFSMPLS